MTTPQLTGAEQMVLGVLVRKNGNLPNVRVINRNLLSLMKKGCATLEMGAVEPTDLGRTLVEFA